MLMKPIALMLISGQIIVPMKFLQLSRIRLSQRPKNRTEMVKMWTLAVEMTKTPKSKLMDSMKMKLMTLMQKMRST